MKEENTFVEMFKQNLCAFAARLIYAVAFFAVIFIAMALAGVMD